MHGDRKGRRRGLRIELVPGEAPRLVLEPWEAVIPSTAGVYRGRIILSTPGSEGAVRLAMEKLILPELGHMVREITK